jgi:HK97 family phage portal protein
MKKLKKQNKTIESNVKNSKDSLEKFTAIVLDDYKLKQSKTFGAELSEFTEINNTELMFLYETHAIVYAIVNKIAKRIAGSGFVFLDNNGNEISNNETNQILEIFKGSDGHLSLLLQMKKWVQDMLVTGDCYIEKVQFNPRVIKIDPISPRYMKKQVNQTGEILGYVQVIEGKIVTEFTNDQVFSEGLNNGVIYGISPVRAIWKEIQADLGAVVFNKKFFENSANPTTLFKLRDEVQSLDKERLNEVKKDLLNSYQGAINSGKPIINNVIEDIKTIERDLNKVQFLGSRDKFIEKACATFDISKVMLGITDSANEATASKSMRQEFYLTAVKPYEQIIERFINEEIFPNLQIVNYKIKIVSQDFTDYASKVESIIELRDTGIITTNQAREKLNEPIIDENWANELMVRTSMGYVPVKPMTMADNNVGKGIYNKMKKLINDNKEQKK